MGLFGAFLNTFPCLGLEDNDFCFAAEQLHKYFYLPRIFYPERSKGYLWNTGQNF